MSNQDKSQDKEQAMKACYAALGEFNKQLELAHKLGLLPRVGVTESLLRLYFSDSRDAQTPPYLQFFREKHDLD